MRTPVDSSSIRSVGFDAFACQLDLEYVGGEVYRYFGVPRLVHQRLMKAASKGGFVNAHIRERYPFRKLKRPRARS